MHRILITGGDGKLARELVELIKSNIHYESLSPSKYELDIQDPINIKNYLDKTHIDYIIHAAAFTRPMNKHAAHPEKSISINIIGTANIAIECEIRKIKLIYISTDYVYPGIHGSYTENSALSPFSESNDGISKYGWTKLGGECAVRVLEKFLIIRACLCDSPFPHEAALVDVSKSLIYTKDAAPLILKLLDIQGVINLGGKAQSVYEFVKTSNPNIRAISRNDIEDVKIAPDTSMDTGKLDSFIKSLEKN